ncbi:MAG: hypothetical protein KJ709_03340 [Nanoarchaeota archaeon]|nr:hypothetical protein [Nanoarchaeota archaeon]
MATSAWNLEEFIELVESWGLMDVLLPFLLVFILLFAILQKSKLLGDRRKNYNLVLSLIMGLMVVIPHVTHSYPSDNWDPVVIMNQALPTVSIIIVAIVMMLILLGIFGGEAHLFGAALGGWISFISFVLILIIFGAAAGWWDGWWWINDSLGAELVAIVVIILVFGIIIGFITNDAEDREKSTYMQRLSDDLRNVFGGGKGS